MSDVLGDTENLTFAQMCKIKIENVMTLREIGDFAVLSTVTLEFIDKDKRQETRG